MPYERMPYFFSDQYDIGMEYAGFAIDWDEVVSGHSLIPRLAALAAVAGLRELYGR
jgi:hypothetical protein